MKVKKINDLHLRVLNLLKKEHLNSFEILNKIKNTKLILNLYKALDDLKRKGKVKTYIKKESKIYYIPKENS